MFFIQRKKQDFCKKYQIYFGTKFKKKKMVLLRKTISVLNSKKMIFGLYKKKKNRSVVEHRMKNFLKGDSHS